MICDNFESSISVAAPPIPPGLDSRFKLLKGNMLGHLGHPLEPGMHPIQEMEVRFLTDRLSGPLTLLHAACQGLKRVGDLSELTVHIVGANIVEMLGIIKWEYLLHRNEIWTSLSNWCLISL